jgi:hypothetical protein
MRLPHWRSPLQGVQVIGEIGGWVTLSVVVVVVVVGW